MNSGEWNWLRKMVTIVLGPTFVNTTINVEIWRVVENSFSSHLPTSRLYLSKLQNIFFLSKKCSCEIICVNKTINVNIWRVVENPFSSHSPSSRLYLSKLQNIFVLSTKCFCEITCVNTTINIEIRRVVENS